MTTQPIDIHTSTLRRFVLGKDGLYPGRRWQGRTGVREAIRAMGCLQIDPVSLIARSHDLCLWGRVSDYAPDDLMVWLYTERQFFEYGYVLFVYPMDEMPYFRAIMRRIEQTETNQKTAITHAEAIASVRASLIASASLNEAMSSREFEGTSRVTSYRSRKDSGLALYYLWITGESIIHSRRNFDKRYAPSHGIVPEAFAWETSAEEADDFFARKVFTEMSMITMQEWAYRYRVILNRGVNAAEAKMRLKMMTENGEIVPVRVEGQKADYYALASDLPLLDSLERGETPRAWQPVSTTTHEEAIFLSPLEMVSARGRAKNLFQFDHIWEIYKPAPIRRFGPYTLPILYGDRLAARIDMKLERKSMTLTVNGFWFEDAAYADDIDFADAVGRGLNNFARFHVAKVVELSIVQPSHFRERLQSHLKYGE